MKSPGLTRMVIAGVVFLSLIPVGRLVTDWVRIAPMIPAPFERTMPRGFDWVQWQDDDGAIVASYVFPRGTAYAAGIRRGDVLYQLEYQQYFNADDFKRAIEGIPPGSVRTYEVLRDGEFFLTDVRITRYPTFLYPLSGMLWYASIWGFVIGGFFHLLGLLIVSPLALRSRSAMMSLLLILASSLWVLGNVARLLMVSMLGPADTLGPNYDTVFQTLTIVSMAGWIAFPAILLNKVINDAPTLFESARWIRYLIYVPTLIIGGTAMVTTLLGSIGPITLDALIGPILFHVCCYIAVSTGLELHVYVSGRRGIGETLSGWSRAGSMVVFGLTVLAALSVLGIVPIFGIVTDTIVGWVIVLLQLATVAPVILLTFATLQHGRVDQVITRTAAYVLVLGIIFQAFVGGMALLDPYIQRHDAPPYIVAGIFVVFLLVLLERLSRPAQKYFSNLLVSERQKARQALGRFADRMRTVMETQRLMNETVDAIGQSLDSRSVSLFVKSEDTLSEEWIHAAYNPEPPYMTKRIFSAVWPHLSAGNRIWAANRELSETDIDPATAELVTRHGIVLSVPVGGGSASPPVGLLMVGPRKRRRAVYNLDDIEILRSVAGQLALSLERISLLDREKGLIRESADAQMAALRAQINPHFLFNALNTISAFIVEKPEKAEEMLEHLAAIFRYVLKTGSQTYVTLEGEWSLVNHYLEIERARFGNNLHVKKTFDSSLRFFPVPAFAVQTLVENAVKHGIEKKRGGGAIEIHARRNSDDLVEIVVADNGLGIPALFGGNRNIDDPDAFFGIGLRNVAGRLEQLYGRNDLLRLSSNPDEGTTAILVLPEPDGPESTNGARRMLDRSV